MYSEVTLTIDGKDYVAALDFRSLSRLEKQMGKSITRFIFDMSDNELSISDLAMVVHAAIECGSGKKGCPDPHKIGQWVFDTGLVIAQSKIIPLINPLLYGHTDDTETEAGAPPDPKA